MRSRAPFHAIVDVTSALARRPPLLRLVGALVLRWTGNSMAMVAYLVVAYQAAGTPGVAAVGIVRMLPAAAIAPLVGPITARVGPERLLVVAYIARALAVAIAAIAAASGLPLAVVLAGAGAGAAAGALVHPLHSALLPAVAETPEELVAANVATSTGEGVATLAGPAIAGLLIVASGPAVALAAATLIALAAALLASTARATEHERHLERPGSSPLAVLRAAVGTLRTRPGALLVLGGFAAQTVVRGLLTTLIVVSSLELLGLGNGGVALLTAALGAGGLTGALVAAARLPEQRMTATFAVALAWWSLPIALVALAPVPTVAVGAIAVVGLSNAVLDVAGYTLLQRTIPSPERVAVLGVVEGVVGIGVATGSFLSPILIGEVGLRSALVVTGATLPVVAAVIWFLLARVPALSVVPREQLASLRMVPVFSPLPLGSLEELARAAMPMSFATGDVLMREGEPGDRYLVLTDGLVEVLQGDRPLRRCGAGDGVGEIALLRRVARTATVRALAPTRAYALDANAFVSAVTGHSLAAAMAEALVDERLERAHP